MKNTSVYRRKFTAFLRKLKKSDPNRVPQALEPVARIVLAFLEWNSTQRAASSAFDRLMAQVVDVNDLRVSHPHEVVRILGSNYPQVEERAARLREVLQDIYRRERCMSLEAIAKRGKKELRGYLDSLSGMTPYVAAQAMLLCFDGHAAPVDDRLAELLRGQGLVDPEADLGEIEAFMERQIKSGQGVEAHLLLKNWADHSGQGAGAVRTKATTKKKTTRKAAASLRPGTRKGSSASRPAAVRKTKKTNRR